MILFVAYLVQFCPFLVQICPFLVHIFPLLLQLAQCVEIRHFWTLCDSSIWRGFFSSQFQFIKWVTSKDDIEDSEKAKEENRKQLSRLMASIAQCEWIENKSKLVQNMNRTEAKNYEKLYEKIKNDISQAEAQIKQTKEEVVEARKIRRNRMEYDALAKVINQNPDRATQGKKIEDIKAELETSRANEASLEDKLESRKKQFHVLVQSIHNLQALLDEDDDDQYNIEAKMELNEDNNSNEATAMESWINQSGL